MKLKKKLYQLVISRLEGERLSEPAYRKQLYELVKKGIGGFILFGGRKDEVKAFIDKIQAVSETSLFIASDIERGVGQQVAGATAFPPQMAVAAATNRNTESDIKLLTDIVKAISSEAIDIGINMPLIPVLDVNTNPDNPIICTRAFSDDPEKVAGFGSTYIKTLESIGLLSCAKHFPGHGDTAIDSHISLPVIPKSLKELRDTELFPFREAVKAGVSAIMVGHLSVPSIDSQPATLSKKMINGLLRNELSFNGLILTDALTMDALKDVKDVYAKSMNAGVDILLHPADADSVVAELKEAIGSGIVAQERIDDAVKRIHTCKSRLREIRSRETDYEQHRKLAEHIFDRSVTVVKERAGLLPISSTHNLSLVIVAEDSACDASPMEQFLPDPSRCFYLGKKNLANVLDTKSRGGTVMIAIFTEIAAWKGSFGIGENEKTVLKALIKKSGHSIIISFGNPYLLRHFLEADLLIAAYDQSEQAQRSVIKYLRENS
jgi:beta-N-acetylhexosaminidase